MAAHPYVADTDGCFKCRCAPLAWRMARNRTSQVSEIAVPTAAGRLLAESRNSDHVSGRFGSVLGEVPDPVGGDECQQFLGRVDDVGVEFEVGVYE